MSIERIPDRIDSKFRFVLLASYRAEQIMRGARAKVDVGDGGAIQAGLEEIFQNAVEWDYGPAIVPEEPVEALDEEAVPAADAEEPEPASPA